MANETFSRLKKLQAAAQALFEEQGLAAHDEARVSAAHKFAHFCVMVGRSFIRNRCPARASALAYTTLLALVPMLAIALSVSTSLLQNEGEKPIRELIDKLVANVAPALNLELKDGSAESLAKRQEVVTRIADFIANIRTGTLGVTSMIALVFVAIGLLRTIEAAFNDIWGVTRGRGWVASVIQYWATITLGPVVLVLAIGLTTGPHFKATAQFIGALPFVGSLLLQLAPFVVLSLAFGAFYQLMPNTRVRWQAALAGGIVGGTLWQLNNLFNVIYVSRVVTYSKIYGSLGIIPLFLIGMYFSWLILLFGAQVAYAVQNRQAYLQERLAEGVNQRGREFVALRLLTCVAQHFQRGEKAPSVNALAAALGVPTRLAAPLLQTLLRAKLVVEVLNGETGYAPARPLDRITAHDVLLALRTGQGQELATKEDEFREPLRRVFENISAVEAAAARETTLEQLARKADG
jgi:membrane protein